MSQFEILLIDPMCMIYTNLCISTCIVKYILKIYKSLYVFFYFLKLKQWFLVVDTMVLKTGTMKESE